jgi:hypothetical protein
VNGTGNGREWLIRFTTHPNCMYVIGSEGEIVKEYCCKIGTGSHKKIFIGQ